MAEKTASKMAKEDFGCDNLIQFYEFFGISKDAAYRLHKNHLLKFRAMGLGMLVIDLDLTSDQIKSLAVLSRSVKK